MKRFVHSAIAFVVAMISATGIAYVLAYLARDGLGVSGPALREQALICAALMMGLITIEFLVSRE